MIKRRLLKITFSLTIIGFSLVGLLSIGQTYAFFSDGVDSNGNIFTAGTLDLTLRSGQGNFVSSAENMQPGNQVNRDIYIGKTSISSPLQYRISYELIGGNEDFCNQLQLKIWYDYYHGPVIGGYNNRDMRLKYNASLTSLVDLIDEDFIIPHTDDQFDTDPNDGTEQWFYYSVILPSTIDDLYQGQVCNFNFVVESWQDNIGNYGDGGFTDVEKMENTIKVGYWNPPVVLNEFLPNAVDYPEFIELYNKTASPIDLNGFYIKANGHTILINAITTNAYSGGITTIPANGWLVVTTDEDLIDNNSGTIALYNGNDAVVDSYTYGSPNHNVNNTPGQTNNLVAYWPFDNDISDKSGNGNNGINDGATFVSGKINEGLSFDGNDNMVVSGVSSLNPSKVTLEAWVKNSGTPGTYKYITGKYYLGDRGSYALYTSGSGGLRFYISHTAGFVASPDAGTGIWDGNWHHIAGTYDGAKVRLYVDGVEVGSGTVTTKSIAYNANDLYIGSYGSGFYWKGIIDEVKIYNRALDAIEILEHNGDVSIPSGSVPADKSYARIPDGSPNWVDPIPTPGAPNKLEEEIEELEPEPELLLEEIIEEIPLITATTTTSTIPDIDILENSTSTSTTIPDQTISTTTEPLVAGAATSTITVSTVEEPTTTTTTTEPPVEESDLTTTTTESLMEETTTTTITIPEETIITITTEPPVEEDFITTTTVPEITTTTTTEPPIEESPTTTTTIQPPVPTNAEVNDLTAINRINIYFV